MKKGHQDEEPSKASLREIPEVDGLSLHSALRSATSSGRSARGGRVALGRPGEPLLAPEVPGADRPGRPTALSSSR